MMIKITIIVDWSSGEKKKVTIGDLFRAVELLVNLVSWVIALGSITQL